MHSRELMRAAMCGEPTERIPSMPQLCQDMAVRVFEEDWIYGMQRCLEEPLSIPDYVIRLVQAVGCDGLRLFVPGAPIKTVREGDLVFQVDEKTGERIGRCDLLGGGGIVPFNPPAPIETLDDARVAVRARLYTDEQIDLLRQARQRIPDLFVASNPGGMTFDPYTVLRPREEAYMDILLRPDYVHAVFDMLVDVSIENAERLLSAGIDGFYIGDAAASASLISPRHFARFCVPYYQRFTRHFAGRGIPMYLHVCGNSAPILELMADTGVHCIEPLDTVAGVNVADAKRRVGDRVVLMGGVNTVLLARGTPDEVRDAAIQCCRDGGPTRYILAAADMVPPDTSLDNLKALVDVATKSLWK